MKYFLVAIVAILSITVHAQSLCKSTETEQAGSCVASLPLACEGTVAVSESLLTVNAVALKEGQAASGGVLQLEVRHGFTQSRQVQAITLSQLGACNYPSAAQHWEKGVDENGCVDTYRSSIPWPVAFNSSASASEQMQYACGLFRSEDDTQVSFSGSAEVLMLESVPSQRGVALTRTIRSVLRFRINFPKQVQASAGVVVFADARVLSAVTQQEWLSTENSARVALTTSLQWPFRVAAVEYAQMPDGLSAETLTLTEPESDCLMLGGGEACAQRWTQMVTPNTTTCRLNGEYALRLTLACHSSIPESQCPIDVSNERVDVTFTLSSEDFCAVVEDTVGVSGALSSHESFNSQAFSFGLTKAAFFQQQALHFRMLASSDDGFALQSTQIAAVVIEQQSGAQVTVFDKTQAQTAAAWQFAQQFNAQSSDLQHEHHFSFVADPQVFGAVSEDQSDVSTVTCVMDLVFQSTETPLKKRYVREILQVQSDQIDASTKFRVEAAPVDDDNERKSGEEGGEQEPPIVDMGMIALIGGASLCMLCLLLVGVVIVVRRYRDYKRMEQAATPFGTIV